MNLKNIQIFDDKNIKLNDALLLFSKEYHSLIHIFSQKDKTLEQLNVKEGDSFLLHYVANKTTHL